MDGQFWRFIGSGLEGYHWRLGADALGQDGILVSWIPLRMHFGFGV